MPAEIPSDGARADDPGARKQFAMLDSTHDWLMTLRPMSQLVKMFVIPEIERRVSTGTLLENVLPFQLVQFRWIQAEGQNIIELNEEVKLRARIKTTRPVEAGQPPQVVGVFSAANFPPQTFATALKDPQLIMVRQRVTIQKRQEGCLTSIAWAHRFEIRFENASEVQCGRIVASIDQIAERLRDWKHHADKRPKRNWAASEIDPAENSTDLALEAL